MNFCVSRYFLLQTLLVFFAQVAFASSDGNFDTTSTGESDVSLTVSTCYRISKIDDLSFGSYSGSGAMSLNDNVCVYTNASGGKYSVRVRGEGTGYAFIVKNTADVTKTIPFTVYWNDQQDTSGNFQVTANSPQDCTGANTESVDCSVGLSYTANFEVRFAASDLLSSKAGTYSGVLTFIIAQSST